MTTRIAVLASGRGSNLQAILRAIADGSLDAEVVGVFSDKPNAPALQQVPPEHRWSARPTAFPDRIAYEAALSDAVAAIKELTRCWAPSLLAPLRTTPTLRMSGCGAPTAPSSA